MRLLLLSCLGMLALATSASAAEWVRATLTTSTTQPIVGEPWRYTITVKEAGRPLAAKARLQVLRGGVVVGCWRSRAIRRCSGATAGTWIRFTGKHGDTFTWPVLGVGRRLTFYAIVVTKTRTLELRAPVVVQPRP